MDKPHPDHRAEALTSASLLEAVLTTLTELQKAGGDPHKTLDRSEANFRERYAKFAGNSAEEHPDAIQAGKTAMRRVDEAMALLRKSVPPRVSH